MFEKDADYRKARKESRDSITKVIKAWSEREVAIHNKGFEDGAEFGYNKANEWHYVKDGDLPKQDGNTCFSIEVLASNKKWVYYQFDSGKWFCGNKEVNVIAWKEIVFPKLPKEIE